MFILLIPRRIPDYADAYYGWNYISSMGSFISVGATITFLVVVYRALVNRVPVSDNAWGHPDYFTDAVSYANSSAQYNTIEWVVPSPTPMHAFAMMPVQS